MYVTTSFFCSVLSFFVSTPALSPPILLYNVAPSCFLWDSQFPLTVSFLLRWKFLQRWCMWSNANITQALQSATQKLQTYIGELETRVDQLQNKK